MAPQTGTALLLLAVFVLPGFITLLLREKTYWVRGEDTAFERLLNALYYSSLIYAAAAVAGYFAGIDTHDVSRLYHGKAQFGSYVALAFAGLFVLPMLLAELGRRWQKSRRLRGSVLRKAKIDPGHSVPAGWEQLFIESPGALEGRGLMLRVTLEDGRIVGGFFGEQSLAGYTAHTRDLFLEERWSLDSDDWFVAPAEGSRGVWIADTQIRSVEAYAVPEPETEPSAVESRFLMKLLAAGLLARWLGDR
jgi:Family of unknown function (DUF6338)